MRDGCPVDAADGNAIRNWGLSRRRAAAAQGSDPRQARGNDASPPRSTPASTSGHAGRHVGKNYLALKWIVAIIAVSGTILLVGTHSSSRRGTAVVCSIVSNEERYLDEWIDYNLGIGFSELYVYDNTADFELGRHRWLDRRGARLAGRVSIAHLPGEGRQGEAYSDCARRAVAEGHRWVFNTDADEYLVLRRHRDVASFLSEHLDVNRGSLAINWQVHSWNGRLTFRPRPVTERFRGRPRTGPVDFHVKTIANADRVDLAASHHPHYPTLKEGTLRKWGSNYAIDTNGERVDDGWKNERRPSDVALVYHFNTKSWREYIEKRSRGRAGTLTGKARRDSIAALIAEARSGRGLRDTAEIDPSAWETLKERNPRYRFFDEYDPSTSEYPAVDPAVVGADLRDEEEGDDAIPSSSSSRSASVGICARTIDQEAYVDEWADYHLALGFDAVHLYDGTSEFWMRGWRQADEGKGGRGRFREGGTTRLSLVHLPDDDGNRTNSSSEAKARAYADCVARRGRDHDALLFLDVNDFFAPSSSSSEEEKRDPLAGLLLDDSSGATPRARLLGRTLFGHGGQYLYDPLPVTKRFFLRLNDTTPDLAPAPALLLRTKSTEPPTPTDDAGVVRSLERDLARYLASGKFSSDVYVLDDPSPFETISVHRYLRSMKECVGERRDDDDDPAPWCDRRGDVEDRSAWERMKRLVPWYSNFEGLVWCDDEEEPAGGGVGALETLPSDADMSE